MSSAKEAASRLSFFHRQEGAIAVWFAIGLPILIGFAALAIDMSFGFAMRNKTQITASAAALAGAALLPDPDAARGEALDFAALNMPDSGSVLTQNDVRVGNWDPATRSFTDNLQPYNAVQVTTRLSDANGNPISLFFASFFGHDTANVNTPAIAVNGGGEPQGACLLSLEPTEPDGIYVNGNNTITSEKCGVCVNSSNNAALRANGTPTIDVGDDGAISVHGGVSETPNVTFNPAPDTGQPACDNPYDDVTEFDDAFENDTCPTGSDSYLVGNVTHLLAGAHCGTYKFNGKLKDVVFDAGIHHFIDADWTGNGPSTVTGDGVTILLTRTELKWNGTSEVHLTAGSSGFVFFQDPADPPGNAEHAIGGTDDAFIDGIQNFGMQDVKYHGTTQQAAGGAPQCNVLVARKFEFDGTVDMTLDASGCSSDLPEVNASNLALRLVD